MGLVFVFADAIFLKEPQRIAALAIEAKLPVLRGFYDLVEAGDPISYGLNVFASFHHGANLCGKILKGARPGDLPIELTTKFKLVINLKTAKTLGTMIAP